MSSSHWTGPVAAPARRLTRRIRVLAAFAGMAILLLAGASSALAQTPRAANAVDPQIVDGTAQQRLDAARTRWQDGHVSDYHFTVERLCFCPPTFRGPVTIVVRDNVALAPPAPFAAVATVPQLHAVVQKAIDDQVEHLNVEYDALGLPLSIYVDRSSGIADDEITYRVTSFGVDKPRYFARGDVRLHLLWRGPKGNATRTLTCRDGELTSAWPDPAVCTRLLTTPALSEPIIVETRDIRFTPDPQLFAVLGHIEGRLVQFTWRGSGSSTRLARLREWETALGTDAIAAVRTP